MPEKNLKNSQNAPQKDTLRAGVAKSDITTDKPKFVVNDRLYAKALVLDDGLTKVAIISMDSVAIGEIFDIKNDFLPKLRSRIEKELGIPGKNVLVNSTHTHPPGPGPILCSDSEQVKRTFDAVKRALAKMTPVAVGAGAGHEDRIMMNRRLRLKNGQSWTIRHCYPCPPDDQVEGLGPIDPEIGILRVDRLDGTPLAVVYNFACHGCMGVPSGGITANFPAFASGVIEETLGHDALAIFLQGAGGDIEEILYKDVTRPMDSEALGRILGLSTLKAYRKIATGNAKLKVISEIIELPRRTDVASRVASLRKEQTQLLESLRYTVLNFKTFVPLYLKNLMSPGYPLDDAYRYMQSAAVRDQEPAGIDKRNRANLDKYIQNIYAMEKLSRIEDDIGTLLLHDENARRSGRPTITTEVQGIRIGDFVLITSPAEILVQVGLNVKQASPHKHTFMAAFSNGYTYYAPPADEYARGGYEVMECELAPEWQKMYEKTAAEVLKRL
jgi:hypothetical protein